MFYLCVSDYYVEKYKIASALFAYLTSRASSDKFLSLIIRIDKLMLVSEDDRRFY